MTEHSSKLENATRRTLLRTGGVAIPVLVTIKSARAQVVGGPGQMMTSIACLQHSEIPSSYQTAVAEVTDTLGLSPTKAASKAVSPQAQVAVSPQAQVEDRPGGWLGKQMAQSRLWRNEDEKQITTQSLAQQTAYQDWSYEDFQRYFQEGQSYFYADAQYDPGNQYHNTFLEITMSTACWNSIQTQMTT